MLAASRHGLLRSGRRGLPGLLTTLLLGFCLAAPAAWALEWQKFDSEQGRFSVELPGEPVVKEKRTWFPMASFISYAYRAVVGHDAFGMNHTDLPRAVLFLVPQSKIIASTRQGFLEDAHATEISFRETTFGDLPAHELVYDMPAQNGEPAKRGTATILFRAQRLYVFWTEVGRDRAQSDLDRFFHSVRLWSD